MTWTSTADLMRGSDHITTIRIVNVPSHTTETEFNCWFLFAAGFEQATLVPTRGNNQSQLGWARFQTAEDARQAIRGLNGRQLTEDQSPEMCVLQADMAKSQFKPSRDLQRKRPRVEEMITPVPVAPPPAPAPVPPPLGSRPPSNTLFLGGLQPGSAEEELVDFFAGHCDGFERLKFVPPDDGRPGMCWAKFYTTDYAEAALQTIRLGYALASNPGTPLQADFAKNALDQPSNGSGPGSGAPAARAAPPEYHPAARPVPAPHHSPHPPTGPPPCDTMFIGGLPQYITERELGSALLTLPGFARVKITGESTSRPAAFALFSSPESCKEAIEMINGTALAIAPHQVLNCTFAKNSLDKRHR